MFQRLFKHTLRYSIGSLLVMIAGFASFPVLTRVFTVEQYGVVGYVSSLLTFVMVFGKLGLQHATLRFYAEVKAGKRDVDEASFTRTVIASLATTGVTTALVGSALVLLLPRSWLPGLLEPVVLLLAIWLVPVRALDSAVNNLLRAQQRSALLSSYVVLRKWIVLAVVLSAVLAIRTSLLAFFLATLFAEACVTLWLVLRLLREAAGASPVAAPARFSTGLLGSMLVFGLPMIAYEFSATLLNLSDRFLIERLMGAEALGLYAAAYNACEYASVILIGSLAQAATPMLLKVWEEQGSAATREFVQRTLHVYLVVAGALLVLGSAMGAEVLSLLAGDAYRAGGVVIPAVLGGLLVAGCEPLLGAGLQIRKRTGVRVLLMVSAAIVNFVANLVLIPLWGLPGAAWGTLIGFATLTAGSAWMGRKTLSVSLPWRQGIKLLVCGGAAYAVMNGLTFDSRMLHLVATPTLGMVVFLGLALASDRRLQDVAVPKWHQLRERWAR